MTEPPNPPDFAALGALIEETMAAAHVPGVAVGVWHAGTEQVAGFGVTSVTNPLPVDADTLFQIGSITKTFTGTAVMRLVEAGQLDLDAPVRTVLPGFTLADEDAAARATLRHLFTHTGGWLGDYFDDTGLGDDALAEIVARMVHLPQLAPLGAVWSYNNAGFYLAGRLIEVVTGQPYEAALRTLVLDPLGLERSFFFPDEVMTYRFAAGHLVWDEQPQVARPWALTRAAHPAGGITATVRDQLRYARFHLGNGTAPDGTRLLSPESLAAMQTPQERTNNKGDHVGLTWMLRNVGGVRLLAHSGGTNGQSALLVLAPAHDFALSILTNADRGSLVIDATLKWALKHYLGVVEPEAAPVDATPDELAAYTGRYSAQLGDLDVSIDAGQLFYQLTPRGGFPKPDSPPGPTPPPVHGVLCGDDTVLITEPPFKGAQVDYLRDAAGRIVWLRALGRIFAWQPASEVAS